ncbi:MAG: NADH-quinone oxidoreductase subunit C [Actinobacteria bacterium]|nr:NADH-quinone oxidoreductase subunit C [Actinomycetota bacterium]
MTELADLGVTGQSRGQDVVHVELGGDHDAVRHLFDDGFTMCVDLTAVDYLGYPNRAVAEGVETERFELVVGLLDLEHRRRVRLRMQISDGVELATITDIHPGAEAMEREVFDMFGFEFTGHPYLKRILLPEEWVGHPLRKDYDIGRIPVQFKDAPQGR